MMEIEFTKTKVPYDSLDTVLRSEDIHVVMFTLKR